RRPGVASPASLPAALGPAPFGSDRARGLPREGRDRLRREDGPAGREPEDHRPHRDAAPPARGPALSRPKRPIAGRLRAGQLHRCPQPTRPTRLAAAAAGVRPEHRRLTTLAPPLNYRLFGAADIRARRG